MQLSYSFISCVGIVALLILEQLVRKNNMIPRSSRRLFRLSIGVVIIVMISEVITMFSEDAPIQYHIPHIIGNLLGFSLSPFIPILIGYAISNLNKKILFLFSIPAIINLISTILSVCFPLIFFVSKDNSYTRGDFFWIYTFSYTISLIYLFVQTLLITQHYQNNNRLIPVMLFCFVVLSTLVQVKIPRLHVSWLCISFALILYFAYYCDLLYQIDSLTGLLNRRAYENNIQKIQSKNKFVIIVFDIDDFKSINDKYGHLFGDDCLIAVASCIKKAFFKIGLCFRIGGDEFCVISKKANKFTVEKAYENFLHEIEFIRESDNRLPMVSIGYSFAESPFKNIADVIMEADQNMYRFKRQHKNSQ